jgi:site-specific DNA-cytosine methylase
MTTNRPRLLDAFCGAGGAAMGYHRAGFEVVGVDLAPQPNYPFEFHLGDAVEFIAQHGHEFDFIHASPPCQAYSALNAVNRREYVDLIWTTRMVMRATRKPGVIENVAGAPIRKDLMLCGEMFGLRVIRHRFFESIRWSPAQPEHRPHRGRVAGMRHGEWFEGPYFAVYGEGGGKGTVKQWQEAMGIHWTDVRKEIAEAIPPAYTQYIGEQVLARLNELPNAA